MFNLSPVTVPDLSGKIILVTGAGKGIGAAVVRLLDAAGARVFAGVFKADRAEDHPAGVTRLEIDVTRQADVDAAITAIKADAGRLYILINNAGTISTIAPLADLPAEALATAFAVNVVGVHRMTSAALPLLPQRWMQRSASSRTALLTPVSSALWLPFRSAVTFSLMRRFAASARAV